MAGAAFLPFVTFDAYGALQIGGQPIPQETGSLIQSQDARWVIVVLVALGAAAALHLAWRYRRISTVALLVASLAAVALGMLEASNSASRVLPGEWGEPAFLSQLAGITLNIGYYLFFGGAVVAFGASLAIASTNVLRPSVSSTPRPSTSIRLSG
jgi:pimeloyl-ACP methyl ester carboxylesterase